MSAVRAMPDAENRRVRIFLAAACVDGQARIVKPLGSVYFTILIMEISSNEFHVKNCKSQNLFDKPDTEWVP